jgi:hypothetical protein
LPCATIHGLMRALVAVSVVRVCPSLSFRAQAILLRRTKLSTINGEPIVKLPPREQNLVKQEFTEQVRDRGACGWQGAGFESGACGICF